MKFEKCRYSSNCNLFLFTQHVLRQLNTYDKSPYFSQKWGRSKNYQENS